MSNEILDYINSNLWGVWYLIGAALVFWMQAGFAMVEAGFTRAKNSGNIIMKNLMDFCIGTVMFIVIGYSFFLETMSEVSLEHRDLIYLRIMQILIFQVLYLT